VAWQEYTKKKIKSKINPYKILFFIFLLYLSPSIYNGLKDYFEYTIKLRELSERKAKLEKEVRELREIAYNMNDPYVIEKIAREKLFMARPGEEPILIIENKSNKKLKIEILNLFKK